jgi:hypothetical protein
MMSFIKWQIRLVSDGDGSKPGPARPTMIYARVSEFLLSKMELFHAIAEKWWPIASVYALTD